MNISRLIVGIVFSIIGIFLTVLAFFVVWPMAIYGIVLLIIGLFVLFNKKEDEIEERKDLNKKKNKK